MGPALCLLSAACFGALGVFGKLAFEAGVSPTTLLLIRFGLAALVMAALLPLERTSGTGSRKAVLTALGLGAIGYAAQAALYFEALRFLDASLLALLLYTYPVLVTVGAVLLGRDRLTPARGLALVVASGGTLLVVAGTGNGHFHPLGAALALGSAITYTVYILVADRTVHHLPPLRLSALVMTGATVTLGARAALSGGVDPGFGARGWLWLACIVGVSTVAAMLTFFAGLRRTGPSTAAILSTFEPVVTTALAALTLGELLGRWQLVGGLLVLSSAVLLQWRRHPYHEPDSDASMQRGRWNRTGGTTTDRATRGVTTPGSTSG